MGRSDTSRDRSLRFFVHTGVFFMNPHSLLAALLLLACLLPLLAAAVGFGIVRALPRQAQGAGYVSTGAIAGSFLLSLAALVVWCGHHPIAALHAVDAPHVVAAPHGVETHAAESTAEPADHAPAETIPAPAILAHKSPPKVAYSGRVYTLAQIAGTRFDVEYYIDSLTIVMFCLVSGIATAIHIYATAYLVEELEPDGVVDHDVKLAFGEYLVRPGRYASFFQMFSFFSFSMLGLVLAGNLLVVFVFWELVGVASYYLIGFYRERLFAAKAAAQAFLVNRIGDFGMLVGLAILFAGFGTLSFADREGTPGLFSQYLAVRHTEAPSIPDGLVELAAGEQVAAIYRTAPSRLAAEGEVQAAIDGWRAAGIGYGLVFAAALGLFCGCVGKSAQFPLLIWLPDAMAGPTPVSALVHSATMVAAGVYLVARVYPLFPAEMLLVVAYVGMISGVVAALFALVANDLKRILAFSTISQLGFMMLGLGLGGWEAGVFHLATHACFKSLLFLGAGAVIHTVHEQDLRNLGGLRTSMPWTSSTMLAACLAMIGCGLPLVDLGLSGYYSKDAILAQAIVFVRENPVHGVLFWIPLATAGLTSFYIFRLWFRVFLGDHPIVPREDHEHDTAGRHRFGQIGGFESLRRVHLPLAVLATLAVVIAWPIPFTSLSLANLLGQAQPLAGLSDLGLQGGWMLKLHVPAETFSHAAEVHRTASLAAFGVGFLGFVIAAAFYAFGGLQPADVKRQFGPLAQFLVAEGYLLALYKRLFVAPTLWLARLTGFVDTQVIDPAIDGLAAGAVRLARVDDAVDRRWIDGIVNGTAEWIYNSGLALRYVQTGRLRHYVLFIAVATITLFLAVSFWLNLASAGG